MFLPIRNRDYKPISFITSRLFARSSLRRGFLAPRNYPVQETPSPSLFAAVNLANFAAHTSRYASTEHLPRISRNTWRLWKILARKQAIASLIDFVQFYFWINLYIPLCTHNYTLFRINPLSYIYLAYTEITRQKRTICSKIDVIYVPSNITINFFAGIKGEK